MEVFAGRRDAFLSDGTEHAIWASREGLMWQTWEPAVQKAWKSSKRSGKTGFTAYKTPFLRRGCEGFLAAQEEAECHYTKTETEGKAPCYSDKVIGSVKEGLC